MRYLAIIFLTMLTAGPAQAVTIRGFVTAIIDGDSLKIQDAHRREYTIHLSGIDAPERNQPFGSQSMANLAKLAFNKDAEVVCPRKWSEGGRCKVIVNGEDIGLRQIAEGMAWWSRRYAGEQSMEDRQAYEQAETWAKLRRFGLWNDTRPVPPWEWRR